MRTFDFAPLYRSTVGFDKLFSLLDAAGGPDSDALSYPPYNIERLGETSYRISMAVAGFTDGEIGIEVQEGRLVVKGDKKPDTGKPAYLYRGIAERAFERRFQLADHVEVTSANLSHGLLHIDLVRNVPERLKPRQIAITSGAGESKQIEAKAA